MYKKYLLAIAMFLTGCGGDSSSSGSGNNGEDNKFSGVWLITENGNNKYIRRYKDNQYPFTEIENDEITKAEYLLFIRANSSGDIYWVESCKYHSREYTINTETGQIGYSHNYDNPTSNIATQNNKILEIDSGGNLVGKNYYKETRDYDNHYRAPRIIAKLSNYNK